MSCATRSLPSRLLQVLFSLVLVGAMFGIPGGESFAKPIEPSNAGPLTNLFLASTNKLGVKGDHHSEWASVSVGGLKVAFESRAQNLHPDDTDSIDDVFVKDLTSGEIALASTTAAGVKGNADCDTPVLSGDGTRVAFVTRATNLDPRDTEDDQDIYVKDLSTGELFLASTSDSGMKANSNSFQVSISKGGRRVAFNSWASNLDPADADDNTDIYVKDIETGEVILASTSARGANSNSGSDYPALSADGERVAFQSLATNLVARDRDLIVDIYVKDLTSGEIVLASLSEDGNKANGANSHASLSADGTRVAFESLAGNLDPVDRDRFRDIYVKDLVSDDIDVASRSTQGEKGNDHSDRPSLSAGGRRVAYYSFATNLDPRDTDLVPDVYVKDLLTGWLFLASITEVGVKGNGRSESPSLSWSGRTVAFMSNATNLDPRDQSDNDIYVKLI
jgi:Tol biopolymer transport system component